MNMNHGITTVIYPVKDLEQAKALYSKLLGVAPYADAPYMWLEAQQYGHGLTPTAKSWADRPVGYYQVDDIKVCKRSSCGRTVAASG
jgi:extradiol dioxygenase family protein